MASSLSSHLLLFLMFVPFTAPITPIVSGDQNANHFHRPDPLRGFRLYEGGYDIRNKHYWASAAFKGIYGFGMAGIWMLGGLLVLGLYPVWKKRFANSLDYFKSRRCRRLMLAMVIIVLVLLVIVSSGLILAACHSFRNRANKLEKTFLGAGGATCHAIRRVLRVMDEIHELLCPYNKLMCTPLRSSRMGLRRTLVDIRMVMHTAGHLFDVALRLIYGVTVGIVCISLALVTVSIVVLLLHWRPGLIMAIFMCWVLTTICWMLSGFHFFLHIYINDTCSALDEFEQNPNNSSLSSILPCPSTSFADATMAELGFWINTFVSELNFNITNLVNITGQEAVAPSGFQFKMILGKDKQYLQQGFLKSIRKKVYFIHDFTDGYWDLRKLVCCSFLKDALNNALRQQCKPLRASIKILFISIITLSLCLTILVFAWMVKMLEIRWTSLSVKSMTPEQIEDIQL